MKNSALAKAGIPLLIVLGAIIVAVILIGSKTPPEKTPQEAPAFLVDASPVSRETVKFAVSSQGNVLPSNQTVISAQVSGRVVSLSDVFVVGGMFSKGDVLAVLEQQDYETDVKLAEAELAQAKAALTEEIARGRVAQQEWSSVNSVVPPELGLRKPQLAREQANVKAAEAKLERARRNLSRTEIKAPYNGLVVNRNIDLGQFVTIGSAIGTIYSTDVAEIRLPVPDSDMAFIDMQDALNRTGNVSLKARVNGIPHSWQADLARTEGVLDSASRMTFVIARIADPYNRNGAGEQKPMLQFGQFVQADITASKERELFVLPRSVMRLDQTVLTVDEDRQLHIKPVDVVRSNADKVYITGGLTQGELVVMSAVPNPYEGMPVRLPGDATDNNDDDNQKSQDTVTNEVATDE